MGGLISLYAVMRHPDTFAGAAGLSTHWPLYDPRGMTPEIATTALLGAIDAADFPDAPLKLWLDTGTETLDSYYAPYQATMKAALLERGFTEDTLAMPTYEGAAHDEASWAARLDEPLLFLLGKDH